MEAELLRRVGKRRADLEEFSAWLDARPAFDVLLDGPNIAYHNQNYEGGSFRFQQIAAMVALLRSQGENVLVLLPQAYVQEEIPNHTCSSQQRDRRSTEDAVLLKRWREQGILYVCPRGIYDDWFWMCARASACSHKHAPPPHDRTTHDPRPRPAPPYLRVPCCTGTPRSTGPPRAS